MHIYGNGRHPGDPLPEGGNMTGGLTDRNDMPFGTWQFRFIDWFRDLGFLQKPGVETKAARDVATRLANPPRPPGQRGRGGAGRFAIPRLVRTATSMPPSSRSSRPPASPTFAVTCTLPTLSGANEDGQQLGTMPFIE